jgi:GxxExxY protein
MMETENLTSHQLNTLAGQIIGAAMEVHTVLGPGLLENTYETCLLHELKVRGFNAASQVYLPAKYKGTNLDAGYRIDLIVEDSIIIELKAVETLTKLHIAQILAYMKLNKTRLGLLINFNVPHLRQGIKRIVNKF